MAVDGIALAEGHVIAALLAKYAYGVDFGDLALIESCFSDDATMRIETSDPPAESVLAGRPAIMASFRAWFGGRTRVGRHLVTNVWLEGTAGATATVVSYLTLMAFEEGGPRAIAMGRYRDVVVKEDKWRFRERHLLHETPHPLASAFAVAPPPGE